jgi:hypothetical protein
VTQTSERAAAARFIPLDEAERRFGLDTLFDLSEARGDNLVLVFDGDLDVAQVPLDLFSIDHWVGRDPGAHPAIGMIVDGNLTVRTHVGNWTTEFGPFLLVRGDLRTQNLGSSSSEIRIEGDLETVQTIYGHHGFYGHHGSYDHHGSTTVLGDVSAETVIVEQHLMRFHGGLTSEVAATGNFLRIADPHRFAVAEWTGRVSDLDGAPHDALGTGTDHALRRLDPLCWDLDRAPIIAAIETGTSLLRRNRPSARRPKGPISDLDLVRHTLIEGGCPEQSRFDGGFRAKRIGRRTKVWTCEADEPDDETEPFDEPAALRACANVLTATGFTVEHDPADSPLDDDVLKVTIRE